MIGGRSEGFVPRKAQTTMVSRANPTMAMGKEKAQRFESTTALKSTGL
jgi:hypothetical protein